MLRTELRLSVQLAIGLVFLVSATAKLRDIDSFAEGVSEYEILPLFLDYPAAILVIVMELSLTLAHLTGVLLIPALVLGLVLLVTLAVAVGTNLTRGRHLPCYCFGNSGETLSIRTLARLALLACGETFLLIFPGQVKVPSVSVLSQIQSFPRLSLTLLWSILLLMMSMWLLSLPDLLRLIWNVPNNSTTHRAYRTGDSMQPQIRRTDQRG